MQRGQLSLESTYQLDVVPAVELGRQAGLNAYLARAELPRFARPSDDLFGGQEISFFFAVVAAERAEGAMLDAYVREVDVAVHDVGHQISALAFAKRVGGGGDGIDVVTGCPAERFAFLDVELA